MFGSTGSDRKTSDDRDDRQTLELTLNQLTKLWENNVTYRKEASIWLPVEFQSILKYIHAQRMFYILALKECGFPSFLIRIDLNSWH